MMYIRIINMTPLGFSDSYDVYVFNTFTMGMWTSKNDRYDVGQDDYVREWKVSNSDVFSRWNVIMKM